MQVFFILFSVHFAVYQYINSKCLYRTHVNYGNIYINALTKKDATLAIYYTTDIMDEEQVDLIVYQSIKLLE